MVCMIAYRRDAVPSGPADSVPPMPRSLRAAHALSATGDEAEVPLTGGRLVADVVRSGDTVRKPASAASPFVGLVLDTLERHGFAGAPRYLGQDTHGRDVLTFVAGRVPPRLQRWSDRQVFLAGRLLRGLHD